MSVLHGQYMFKFDTFIVTYSILLSQLIRVTGA
nr:MAG TPA: hypothetical protein [Caudoviricetes sp.]